MFSIAVSNTSSASFPVASLICSNASYTIDAAVPRLPSSITRLIRRVTSCELYNGSGNTSRFGALFLRLILSYLPSYYPLGRLAPYLERLCLRSATPAVSSAPRTMW